MITHHKNNEILIKDLSTLPKYIFHLVPEKLFSEYLDKDGNYDCRNKKEWGNNSMFIHTTPTKEQLKERVADPNWSSYPLEDNFFLLRINTRMINGKITYAKINNNIYHHIWEKVPRVSFKIIKVDRSKDGKFLL